ncbi:MAG TPA: hypothetical protein VJ762_14570 [Sphingobium sp.]|nr:hypothetical protein [Sphingobium sp.]
MKKSSTRLAGLTAGVIGIVTLTVASAALMSGSSGSSGPATGQSSGLLSLTQLVSLSGASTGAPAGTPIVFNSTQTAKAGDIIYLQGHDFGGDPKVLLDPMAGLGQVTLPILSRNENWVAVQIPVGAKGGLAVRVANGSLTSAPVRLNGARPLHIDALSIVPGGQFRIFGRNLKGASGAGIVKVDGMAATVDGAKSDETMLTVKAPTAITAKSAAVITVDNGNGTGVASLEQPVEIVAATASLPFGGTAGWTATFTPLTRRVVNIACANNNVGQAVQDAVTNLAAGGGGIVHLGAGSCNLERGIGFESNVIVEGSGQKATVLRYQRDYPIWAENLHHVALRNMTLTNAGTAREGAVFKKNRFAVMQNVTFNMGAQKQSFFDQNRNLWVSGCIFNQKSGIDQQSPYLFTSSKGMIFENNATIFSHGASAFERVSDAYIGNNDFERDASRQFDAGTVHMLTVDFATRLAVVGNRFKTANGAITNKTRNDGESILTEGGGSNRTESIGTVGSATATSVTDAAMTVKSDPFGEGFPENYGIAIVAGRGAGQTRTIKSFSGGTATVDRPWDVIPDGGSKYATFVWGLEKSLLKGNSFADMPRGIWLYQAAVRDVDVIDNSFSEGGGIYLRSYQNLSQKMFDPIYNIRIARNVVQNTRGNWMSHMIAMFVNSDARAYGIAMLGISFEGNGIVANRPNLSSGTEEYAGNEGYFAMMRVENYSGYESSTVPRVFGTIFQNNRCDYCNVEYRVGTGSGNTIIRRGASLSASSIWEDWKTSSSPEKSWGTLIL